MEINFWSWEQYFVSCLLAFLAILIPIYESEKRLVFLSLKYKKKYPIMKRLKEFISFFFQFPMLLLIAGLGFIFLMLMNILLGMVGCVFGVSMNLLKGIWSIN